MEETKTNNVKSFEELKQDIVVKSRLSLKKGLIVAAIFLGAFVVIFSVFAIFFECMPSVADKSGAFASVYGAEAILLLGVFVTLGIYTIFSCSKFMSNLKELCAAVASLSLSASVGILLCSVSPYMIPVALTAFLMSTMARKRDGFIYNLFTSMIVSGSMLIATSASVQDVMITFTVGTISGVCVAYSLRLDTRRIVYFLKGIIVAALSMVLYLFCSLCVDGTLSLFVDNVKYFAPTLVLQFVAAMVLTPLLELAFNLITNQRLVELTNRDSKLIQILMTEAPGSYNHSLAVANFAEICAIAIDENPYLARAAAFYHDVGKSLNSIYFTENQSGTNPHDDLLPEVSAEIIRKHTVDGYELCKKYKIPQEIASVTIEHHGTLPIAVFYNKAKSLTDSEVDIADYSYHGATPTSKIAAIIMICDAGEAAIRAMDKPDGERVDKLLRDIIRDRTDRGQFDNCPITIHDLSVIRTTIVGAYGGLFHNRIKYPNGNIGAEK